MNINIKKIPLYFKKALYSLQKFLVPIFILLVVGVNGFLVYKINQFSTQEPSSEQVSEQQNIIKRINIDQEAIDKILSLEERNIAVKSLFKEARNNPFKD